MPGMLKAAPERTDTSRGFSTSPNPLPVSLLELLHVGHDVVPQARRKLLARGVVGVARLGRDREARRDRQPRVRHLGEAGALAAEERAHRRVALAEGVDQLPVRRGGGLRGGAAGLASGRGHAADRLLVRSRRGEPDCTRAECPPGPARRERCGQSQPRQRATPRVAAAMASMTPITTQNRFGSSNRPDLEVHSHDPRQHDRRQQDDRGERQEAHRVVRALRGPRHVDVERADQHLAGIRDRVGRAGKALPDRRQRVEPVTRALRHEVGPRQLGRHLVVRGDDPPHPRDPAPHGHEPIEKVALRAQRGVVELVHLPLEALGGIEERVHVPVEHRCQELDRRETADLALILDRLAMLVQVPDVVVVVRDDPAVADQDLERNRIGPDVIAEGNDDDLDTVLQDPCRRLGRHRREGLRGLLGQLQRLPNELGLILGRIEGIHPQQLVLLDSARRDVAKVDLRVAAVGPRRSALMLTERAIATRVPHRSAASQPSAARLAMACLEHRPQVVHRDAVVPAARGARGGGRCG